MHTQWFLFEGYVTLNHKLIRHLFLQSITTEKTTHRNHFQKENVGTLAVSSLNKNPLVAGTWWYKFMVLPFSSGEFWASNVLFFSSIWVFPKMVGTPELLVFLIKNDHFGVWNGGKTHHLDRHSSGRKFTSSFQADGLIFGVAGLILGVDFESMVHSGVGRTQLFSDWTAHFQRYPVVFVCDLEMSELLLVKHIV